MQKIIISLILTNFLLYSSLIGQDNNQYYNDPSLEKLYRINIDFTGISLSYELPLSNKVIVDSGIGIGSGYLINDKEESMTWNLNQSPSANIFAEVKYIYNQKSRVAKGKSVKHNSGNYIAFKTKFSSGDVFNSSSIYHNAFLNQMHWGIQRSLGERWLLNFHLGISLLIDLETSMKMIYPALGLKFSYNI